MKAKAEAEREEIFKKLALEEERRRADQEYIENLRNELQFQETEEEAKKRDMENMMKRERTRQELLAAQEYQKKLKTERQAEEKRMEEDFKSKLMEKFAEDERLEQMNAQKRRMKELEHKR